MLDGLFASLYSNGDVTIPAFCIASLLSLALGFGISWVYRKVSHSTGTMAGALRVLPFWCGW